MEKPKILIVEDQAITALTIEDNLLNMGYDVTDIIDRGEDVISAIENNLPDLILMDIYLKGKMTGIDVSEIVAQRFSIPVVHLTASSDDKTVQKALKASPYGYIIKPFDERQLKINIDVALYKHEVSEKLIKNEKLLKAAQEIANFGHWEYNHITKEFNYSDEMYKIYELEIDIATSDDFPTLVHPEDRDYVVSSFRSAIKENIPYELVHRLLLKNNKLKYIKEKGETTYNGLGEPMITIGTTQDITESKLAQSALRNLEIKHQDLFENINDAVVDTDRKGRVKGCNTKTKQLFGYEDCEVTDYFISDLIFPKDKKRYKSFFIELVKQGSSSIIDLQVHAENGALKYVNVSAKALYKNGRFVGSQSVLRDITTEKKAQLRNTVINSISRELNKDIDLSSFLNTMYRYITSILLCDNFQVSTYDDSTKLLTHIYSVDSGKELVELPPSELKENGLSKRIIERKKGMSLGGKKFKDIQKREKINNLDKKTKSWLGVPLMIEEKVIGIITLQSFSSYRIFSEDDFEFMKFVGTQVGSFIERKKIEEYLILNEASLRGVFNSIMDELSLVDKETFDLVKVNQKMCESLQYSKETLTGMNFNDICHCKEFLKVEKGCSLEEVLEKDESIETFYTRKDGTSYPVELKTRLINYQGKEVLLILARDLTERIKNEEAMVQLASIVENANVAIFNVINERFASWNKASEKMFGYKPTEIIGKEINVLIPRELKNEVEEYKKPKKGTIAAFETYRIRKDGARVYTSQNVFPLKNTAGKIIGNSLIIQDITARKEAEEKLLASQAEKREQEAKYQKIFDNAPIAILQVGRDGVIISSNTFCEEVLGFKQNELTNQHISILLPPQMSENVHFDLMEQFFKAPTTRKMTQLKRVVPVLKKEGTFFSAEITLSHFLDEELGIEYAIALLHDVSHKEEAKKMMKSLLEKEVLLKEIHHRVKNNMQIISSLLSLQSNYIENEKALETLKVSQNRIKSMALVHEQLYQTENLSSIDSKGYVEGLLYHLANSFEEYKVALESEIQHFELEIDKAIPCGLIINELISNSYKYAFDDFKNAKINLAFTNENADYKLVIYDNGKGANNLEELTESNSLGVKLVYSLVDQLKGKITVELEKGIKYIIEF